MKRNPIPDHIKTAVAQRADFKCEYCLLSDIVSFYNFHIDHIKSIKQGGVSHIDNLSYCWPDCNYCKGTDIGSAIENDKMIRFFNPRKDKWHEHFYLEDGMNLCKTEIAHVTESILKFNDLDRLIYRWQLIHLNQYP